MSSENKKILLIGDECVDRFVYGSVTRINPESPTPIFDAVGKIIENKGMVGNVEANIKSLSQGKLEIIKMSNFSRPVKERFVDEKSGQILLRVDHKVAPETFDISIFNAILIRNELAAIVISDYCKGYLSYASIFDIVAGAKSCGKDIPVFCDTKKVIDYHFTNCDFIKINEKEHSYQKDAQFHCLNYIYTRGKDGCVWINESKFLQKEIAGHNVDVACVSGAGDTVLAALVVKYLENKGNIEDALKFSMRAAAEAVKHRNVVAVNRADIIH